jgi:hypothetical protein
MKDGSMSQSDDTPIPPPKTCRPEIQDSTRKHLSKVHEWINSLGVVAALGVSIYFGWRTDRLKSESLLITGHPTSTCSVKVGAAVSGVCWSVIVANESENRLSIVRANWRRILLGGVAVLGFDYLSSDQKPLAFPINLDGGEGKQIIVRAFLLLTSDVADINRSLGEDQRHDQSLPLRNVQLRFAAEGLDVLGNNVNPVRDGKDVISWRWESPFRQEVDLLTLRTGRGGEFSTTLAYPSATGNWGPE